MNWRIDQIINFEKDLQQDGLACPGFHDIFGNQYAVDFDDHWLACLDLNGSFRWTAGSTSIKESPLHITCELMSPTYLTDVGDGSVYVTSSGNKRVYCINPQEEKASLFIDGEDFGLKDIGNCEWDGYDHFWINEITGCRVWKFDLNGQPKQILGNGNPGFQCEATSYDEVRFNWIYDIRRGSDGNIYVLDSRNYAIRLIDVQEQNVKCVVGTGKPGYSGDGNSAYVATLGGNPSAHFDGPWSLSVDEKENLFIGDTQNHVVRMVDKATNKISTIAGNSDVTPGGRNIPEETDPLKLNLPLICSMDYYDGKLFIPEWDGDLVILTRE